MPTIGAVHIRHRSVDMLVLTIMTRKLIRSNQFKCYTPIDNYTMFNELALCDISLFDIGYLLILTYFLFTIFKNEQK